MRKRNIITLIVSGIIVFVSAEILERNMFLSFSDGPAFWRYFKEYSLANAGVYEWIYPTLQLLAIIFLLIGIIDFLIINTKRKN